MRHIISTMICLVTASVPLFAQQSASYRMDEHVFNQGGHPSDGMTVGSASFRISLDSLGEGVVRSGLSSSTYRMDASFASAYPPPGEVLGLRFLDQETLTWNPEPSIGVYAVYRDTLATISSGQYGSCWRQDVADESVVDTDPIGAGDGFFYLVTAKNRLEEEGSKGRDSSGTQRAGNACP